MAVKTKQKSEEIIIEGAEMHNLKNISLKIPKKQLIVITGLSGSGKSSLAFDTIFAEGQRRFIESLSSYARQFLGKIKKPKVKKIQGLSPAIAIEQKVNNSNPRSTVGTSSEIYDYIKLLYSRIGKTYSPITGKEVVKENINTVINYINTFDEGDKFLVMTKLVCPKNIDLQQYLKLFLDEGYARIESNGTICQIEEFDFKNNENLFLVVDRSIYKKDKDYLDRITDSIENAFYQGNDEMYIKSLKDNKYKLFSKKFEEDGIKFLKPTEHLFSFNNPYGACSNCNGYGDIMGIDPELVIPNTGLSVYEECIAPWRGQKLSKYKDLLVNNSQKFNFPIHRPYFKLTETEKKLLWEGNEHFKGINFFFSKLEKKMYKIQNRVMLSRYRGRAKCNECNGTRLRKEADYVKINGSSISDLVNLPVENVLDFFNKIKLSDTELKKCNRVITEIKNRLSFLCKVGLPYLTLNRKSNTLSGGETQRINIATSIGSALVGSIYVLDEPSVGLHPEDTSKLISILQNLRSLGNTVIIVEHDEDIIRSADQIIDLGPGAGILGGEIVAQGSLKQILNSNTITTKYLKNQYEINVPSKRRISSKRIELKGCRENNLKNLSVNFPLNSLVSVTGWYQDLFPVENHQTLVTDLNQSERLVVFRSEDLGRNWRKERELGSDYGGMYPGLIRLYGGRLLMTFTLMDFKQPLGLWAIIGRERPFGFDFDFQYDRLILSRETLEGPKINAGFGSTQHIGDNKFITSYSYQGIDKKTHLEIVKWILPVVSRRSMGF